MKDIKELLTQYGIDVPEDVMTKFESEFNSNYKTIAEFNKKLDRLTTENDGLKEQLETATASLKGFDGVNIDDLKTQLAEAQKRAKEAEDSFNAKMASRDFDEALANEMGQYKFTSKGAKDSVMKQIRDAKLQCVNGKILGLGDLISTIKEADADAFADDEQTPPPAKFTAPINGNPAVKYTSRDEIMNIKNAKERQQAIEDNIELFK